MLNIKLFKDYNDGDRDQMWLWKDGLGTLHYRFHRERDRTPDKQDSWWPVEIHLYYLSEILSEEDIEDILTFFDDRCPCKC